MEIVNGFLCALMFMSIASSQAGVVDPTIYYPNNPFLSSSDPTSPNKRQISGLDYYHHYHHQESSEPNERMKIYKSNFSNSSIKFFDDTDQPKITSRRDIPVEEEVPDYPYEEIRKLLESDPFLKSYFREIPVIGNRGGTPDELDDGEYLCSQQIVTIAYPKKLTNVNNVDRIIVNDDKEYRQAIRQTICKNNGKKCNIPFEAFGYTSYCHQQYDSKRLMVFENNSKTIVHDDFTIPSCCVCKVKKI